MDLKKAWQITLKDVRITFSDRNLLLIMFVAPLALILIIGAAFSNFLSSGNNDVAVQNVPVAVANNDKGTSIFGQTLNYGEIITNLIVPPTGTTPDPKNTLFKLLNAKTMSEADAIAAVNKGDLVAAIIIPSDFSESLNPSKDKPKQTQITVYRDSGSPLTGGIAVSVIHNIVNTLVSGNIAIFAAKDQVAAGKANPLLLAQSQDIANTVSNQAQTDTSLPIKILDFPLTGPQASASSSGFNPLQYFAPSMAIFFLTFTAVGAASSIIEEQNGWTLQRLLTSPTSRATVLIGKLGATFAQCLIQLTLLIFASSLIGPILGSKDSVWGTNILGIALLTICAAAAATGMGTLIAGFARTAEQVNSYGNAIVTVMGVIGGAFFDVSQFAPLNALSKLTLNAWTSTGYATLARGADLGAVVPNMVVLLLMFVVFFGLGLALFNRRLKA